MHRKGANPAEDSRLTKPLQNGLEEQRVCAAYFCVTV